MDKDPTQRIERALASLSPEGQPEPIAHAVAEKCTAIARLLSPVLGQRGVAALYGRSLHVVARRHPWMAAAETRELAHTLNAEPLRLALNQQTGAEAAAGGALLLQTLYELLTSLVGSSLTERLLRPIWAQFPGAPSPQDNSP